MPGNEGRGYILRRSIRQGVRHARQLGIESDALGPVVETAIEVMSEEGYEDLLPRADFIHSVVSDEEQRFRRTLDAGVARLDDLLAKVPTGGQVDGARMFELYDTFGFPPGHHQGHSGSSRSGRGRSRIRRRAGRAAGAQPGGAVGRAGQGFADWIR